MPRTKEIIMETPQPSNGGAVKDKFSSKKQQLLEVAAQLFIKKGFFATSMNEIAAQMGFNKASLYYYCRNKEEIALEIERLNFEYVKNIFLETENIGQNGLEKLRYFFLSYVKLMTTPIGAAGTQIVAVPHSEELAIRAKLLFKEVDNKVRGYIIEGQIDGSIAQISVKWSDFVLFGTLHWIPRWYTSEGSCGPEQLGNELFDVMLKGLLPR